MIFSSIAKPTAGRIAPTSVMPSTKPLGIAFWRFCTVAVLPASAARKVGIARTAAHGMNAVQCIRLRPPELPSAAYPSARWIQKVGRKRPMGSREASNTAAGSPIANPVAVLAAKSPAPAAASAVPMMAPVW